MDAGFFDVFHHPADEHLAGRVAQRVDVDFDGVFEEAVDQHGALGRQAALLAQAAEPSQLVHGRAQCGLVVDDRHGPSTKDVAGPYEGRVADALDDGQGMFDVDGGATGRLRDLESVAQPVPTITVLGEVDRIRAGSQHQVARQTAGQLQRCLAAEGDDDALTRCSASTTFMTSSNVSGSK